VTYGICYRGVETLDFVSSGAVQERVDYCGEIAVYTFVRMAIGEMGC
jgi:hypothetical protein